MSETKKDKTAPKDDATKLNVEKSQVLDDITLEFQRNLLLVRQAMDRLKQAKS